MSSKRSQMELNDEVKSSHYSAEEMETNRMEAEFIRQLIEVRNKRNITQTELQRLSGVTQSAIARLESGAVSPGIKTILKLLRPLRMTLKIVHVKRPKGRRAAKA